MKMRRKKATGSHQRGAEILPGAGMRCPRARPPSSGQAEEKFREGGNRVVQSWREQNGVSSSPLFHCSVTVRPCQMPLFLFVNLAEGHS